MVTKLTISMLFYYCYIPHWTLTQLDRTHTVTALLIRNLWIVEKHHEKENLPE